MCVQARAIVKSETVYFGKTRTQMHPHLLAGILTEINVKLSSDHIKVQKSLQSITSLSFQPTPDPNGQWAACSQARTLSLPHPNTARKTNTLQDQLQEKVLLDRVVPFRFSKFNPVSHYLIKFVYFKD